MDFDLEGVRPNLVPAGAVILDEQALVVSTGFKGRVGFTFRFLVKDQVKFG